LVKPHVPKIPKDKQGRKLTSELKPRLDQSLKSHSEFLLSMHDRLDENIQRIKGVGGRNLSKLLDMKTETVSFAFIKYILFFIQCFFYLE
jgi:hypothetical protein